MEIIISNEILSKKMNGKIEQVCISKLCTCYFLNNSTYIEKIETLTTHIK